MELLRTWRIQLLLTFSILLLFCREIVGGEEEVIIRDLGGRALFAQGRGQGNPTVSNPPRIHGTPRILEEIRTDVENVLIGRQVRSLEDYKACKAQHASDSGIKNLSACLGTLFGFSQQGSTQQGQQVNPGMVTNGNAYGNYGTQAQGYGSIGGAQNQQWGQQQSSQQGLFGNEYDGQAQGQQDPYYSLQYGQGQGQLQDPSAGYQQGQGYYQQGQGQGQNLLNQYTQEQGGQYPFQDGQYSGQQQGGQGGYPYGTQAGTWDQFINKGVSGRYPLGHPSSHHQNPFYNRYGGQQQQQQQQQQALGAGTGYEKRSEVTRSGEQPTRTFYRQSMDPFII